MLKADIEADQGRATGAGGMTSPVGSTAVAVRNAARGREFDRHLRGVGDSTSTEAQWDAAVYGWSAKSEFEEALPVWDSFAS